jgi:hypothetical protein
MAMCDVVAVDDNGGPTDASLRLRFIQDNPELLRQFSTDMLPLMLQVYGSTVLPTVSLLPAKCHGQVCRHMHISCSYVSGVVRRLGVLSYAPV